MDWYSQGWSLSLLRTFCCHQNPVWPEDLLMSAQYYALFHDLFTKLDALTFICQIHELISIIIEKQGTFGPSYIRDIITL